MEKKELANIIRKMCQGVIANVNRLGETTAYGVLLELADKLDSLGCEHDWEYDWLHTAEDNPTASNPTAKVRRCRKCSQVENQVDREWRVIFKGKQHGKETRPIL